MQIRLQPSKITPTVILGVSGTRKLKPSQERAALIGAIPYINREIFRIQRTAADTPYGKSYLEGLKISRTDIIKSLGSPRKVKTKSSL